VDTPEKVKVSSPSMLDRPADMWSFLLCCMLIALSAVVSHIDPVFERSRILLCILLFFLLLCIFTGIQRRAPLHRALMVMTMIFSLGALFYLFLMLCFADAADTLPRSLFFFPGLLVYPGVAGILILLAMAVPSLLSHFSMKNMREAYNALGVTVVALLFLFLLFIMEGSSLLSSRRMGLLLACKGNLKSISSALEYYSSDHAGRYPASLNDLVPDYLESVPSCSASGGSPYHYESTVKKSDYTVWCEGRYHLRITGSRGFPQYSSAKGIIERPTVFPGLDD